jgi:hypothetical protein
MTATTLSGLETQAYNDGCSFAQNDPGGSRVLLLAFGEATDISANVGYLRLQQPRTAFSNPQILDALESAANGVHAGYITGFTTIVYGTSNYHMTQRGLSDNDTYNVGYWQEMRSDDLYNYQQDNGYAQQNAVAASDTEPDYDTHVISNGLVKGATDAD